jgi:hypothetical protein
VVQCHWVFYLTPIIINMQIDLKDKDVQSTILKGVAANIMQMSRPSVEEINKLFAPFGLKVKKLKDAGHSMDADKGHK